MIPFRLSFLCSVVILKETKLVRESRDFTSCQLLAFNFKTMRDHLEFLSVFTNTVATETVLGRGKRLHWSYHLRLIKWA